MAQSKYYKVLTNDLNHNGYQYKLGLNILEGDFITTGECSPGGLYFCKYENVINWLDYNDDLKYICEVELCPDSKVVSYDTKLKTDKFILKNKILISTFLKKNGLELAAVKQSSEALKYVKKQDKDICLAAVNQDRKALRYVKKQDKDICLAAVNQYGEALQHVKKQDKDIFLAAVKQNGDALRYVIDQDQDKDICLAAVKQDGHALRYVKDQDKDICLAAVKQNGDALSYVIDKDKDICLAAVKQNGGALCFVIDKYYDICNNHINKSNKRKLHDDNNISPNKK